MLRKKKILNKWKAEPSSQHSDSQQSGLRFRTLSALPGAGWDLTWESLSWEIRSTLPRPPLAKAARRETSYQAVGVSSPQLPDGPLESSVSMQETLEFSTCARLPCFFNLSHLFLAHSLAEVAYKASPVCPSLISFQLPGWTFSMGALTETQTSEKTFPSVVRSYIKPRLLRGLAAGSGDGDGTWQMAVAAALWRPVWGHDCLYIGFHLCIGLIFIFLRYPDAMVIDWLETTHLSGFRGGRRLPSRVQWSLKCLIRCRGISAWVHLCQFSWVNAIPRLERDWAFLGLTSPPLLMQFSVLFISCWVFPPAIFFVLEAAFMWLPEFAELIRVGNLVVKQVQPGLYEIM